MNYSSLKIGVECRQPKKACEQMQMRTEPDCLARLRHFIGGRMATRVAQELENAKHNQDLPEISRAAEAARLEDRRRTEQERELETKHEAQVSESRRARFVHKEQTP